MDFQIFFFFLCISCPNIVSSFPRHGHGAYQQHSERFMNQNYPQNPNQEQTDQTYHQSLNHVPPSHISFASLPAQQYEHHEQQESFHKRRPGIILENISESSAYSQANAGYVDHKPLTHTPQPHQELPLSYFDDFKHQAPTTDHVYRRNSRPRNAKPWHQINVPQEPNQQPTVPQETQPPGVAEESYYQPTVFQETQYSPRIPQKPFHQPTVFREPQHSLRVHQKTYHQPTVSQEPQLLPRLPQDHLLPILQKTRNQPTVPQEPQHSTRVPQDTNYQLPVNQENQLPVIQETHQQPTVYQKPHHSPRFPQDTYHQLPVIHKNHHQPTVSQKPQHSQRVPQDTYHQLPVIQETHFQPTVPQEPQHSSRVPQDTYHQLPLIQETLPQEPKTETNHKPNISHQQIQLPHQQPREKKPPQPTVHVETNSYQKPFVYSELLPNQLQQPPKPTVHVESYQPPIVYSELLPNQLQQTYNNPEPSLDATATQTEAQVANSEIVAVEILASNPEIKKYLESALSKHYLSDDFVDSLSGNSHVVKLNDNQFKNSGSGETTESLHANNIVSIPHYNNNMINSPIVISEKIKPETTSFNTDNKGNLNDLVNPTNVRTLPIEVKPVDFNHNSNSIIEVDEPQKNHPSEIPVKENNIHTLEHKDDGNTPFESNKKGKLYDHVNAHELSEQYEPKTTTNIIQPENVSAPTNDEIIADNPVDKPFHDTSDTKESLNNTNPLLEPTDIKDDLQAPILASTNSKYDEPDKESYSDAQSPPEDTDPTDDTNSDVITKPELAQKEDLNKTNLTDLEIDSKQNSNNENVDNIDELQQLDPKADSLVPVNVAKQSSVAGSPLNVDSPADDETPAGVENVPNDNALAGDKTNIINNGAHEEIYTDKNIGEILTTSDDFWDKFFTKHENIDEVLIFDVEAVHPIVERTSRLFTYSNHTTVEEIVETVWERKGDPLPLEIKLTTIIKNPTHELIYADISGKTLKGQLR